jgi:hypothetical protein
MENYVTTIPYFIDKYLPYTEQEYIELKNIMSSITTHIPNDRMNWVWNNHNKILNTNEPIVCSCKSAANHWVRAAGTIRNFILQVESQP